MNNCPNCWGYQEYNGETKAVTVETIYIRRMPSMQTEDYKIYNNNLPLKEKNRNRK